MGKLRQRGMTWFAQSHKGLWVEGQCEESMFLATRGGGNETVKKQLNLRGAKQAPDKAAGEALKQQIKSNAWGKKKAMCELNTKVQEL